MPGCVRFPPTSVGALNGEAHNHNKGDVMQDRSPKILRAIRTLATASLLAAVGNQTALAQFSAVDMTVLGPGEVALGPSFGASTLVRDANGVSGTVHVGDLGTWTSKLDTRRTSVYSVWAIVFNNPDECLRVNDAGICSPGEEAPRDGGVKSGLSIFWVAGAIASPRRAHRPPLPKSPKTINVAFRIEGPPVGFVVPAFSPDGLTNPLGAEIHFAVAPHPEAKRGNIAIPLTVPGPVIRGAVHQAE